MYRQARAPAGMLTCENSWYLSGNCQTGVYQDVFQVAVASLCNYRWNWEDCCSSRVSRQDFEVVKQNVHEHELRTRGILS